MIRTSKELSFSLMADMMMNRGVFRYSLSERIRRLFYPDLIIDYLVCLRKTEYYYNRHNRVLAYYYNRRLNNLGVKLGFTIPINVCGFGLVIPHHGTVVIGGGNSIGNYCVFHTSTCVTAGKKKIGDGFYLSTGAKVLKDIEIGNNISVAANAVMNSSFVENNAMVAGIPATFKKYSEPWFIRDGDEYERRHSECENLFKIMMK